jgi:hypothetical protein
MKLSKHPAGTIVQVVGKGKFTKGPNNWYKIDADVQLMSFKEMNKLQKLEPHKVHIIAAPWRVVVELIFMLQEEYGARDSEGNPITIDSIYKDAIARDEESDRIEKSQERFIKDYSAGDAQSTRSIFSFRRSDSPGTKEG